MIKKFAIRIITPLSWRLSRGRLGRSLHRFSQIEADSAWQLLRALDAVDDPSYRAKLFENALEEVHHAALFSGLAREYSPAPPPLATKRRETIYDPARGVADFEARLYVGEADVYEQFLSYADASPDPRVRETFIAIRGDEDGHRQLAYSELRKMAQSESATRRLLGRARLLQLHSALKRFGEAMGDLMFSLWLSVIYFIAAPLLGRPCRRRLVDGVGRNKGPGA